MGEIADELVLRLRGPFSGTQHNPKVHSLIGYNKLAYIVVNH